ncbi:hypothetical protein [Pseudomonas sp. PLB05]|uniref:hypothetical protein n=1 Tax=Pseudomonas sp. PLB05 TaxID=2899078 RepID=UPI001E5C0878|nr:hypothetical protein [Pseudomonas sp. PLB05]MCD4866481.1 hypothetical protein [Pseudomonas sp. PLB05]
MEYNKAFFDCLGALRRRLRQEQGMVIRFDEAEAVPRMLAASQASDDPETRELGERLARLSGLMPVVTPLPSMAEMAGSTYVSQEFLAATRRYTGPLRG